MGILVQPGRGIPQYFRHCVVMKLLLLFAFFTYCSAANLPLHQGPMKLKRGWRSRWGNKYADNKSYGFWITALNKAGNYKRGKRGEPFVPGLSAAQPPFNIVRALKGGDDADLKELVVDHDYTQERN